MDNIWDRKSFVVVGMKKTNDHAEPTKVPKPSMEVFPVLTSLPDNVSIS